jgi:hypothetical protein
MSGAFGRSLLPPSIGGVLRGAFGDGSLLLAEHMGWSGAPREGRSRPLGRAYRLDPHGRVADTLPLFPGIEFHLAVMPPRGSGRGGVTLSAPPFGRRTVFAAAGQGSYAGSQDGFVVGHYDEHGTLEALVRWPDRDRAVTPDQIARYERHELQGVSSESRRRTVARYLSEQTYPDLLPAYGDVLVEADGNLWVGDYHLDWQATRRSTVFDRAHRMLGTVEVPGSFTMLQVGDDFVLGRVQDEIERGGRRVVRPDQAPLTLTFSTLSRWGSRPHLSSLLSARGSDPCAPPRSH